MAWGEGFGFPAQGLRYPYIQIGSPITGNTESLPLQTYIDPNYQCEPGLSYPGFTTPLGFYSGQTRNPTVAAPIPPGNYSARFRFRRPSAFGDRTTMWYWLRSGTTVDMRSQFMTNGVQYDFTATIDAAEPGEIGMCLTNGGTPNFDSVNASLEVNAI